MQKTYKSGFIALTAVILLATASLVFAVIVVNNAASYADAVMRHELRIQAKLNAESCLESVKLMLDRDYFLNGKILLKDFNCTAFIENNYLGNMKVFATSSISGVSSSISSDRF